MCEGDKAKRGVKTCEWWEYKKVGGKIRNDYSQLLIVLLEVAQVDRLGLLDLVHVLKSYSTAREDLFNHEGATPVRSEFASTVS